MSKPKDSKKTVIVTLPEGPVDPSPSPFGKTPLDEIPNRTGEFLMRKGVPVPPEPIQEFIELSSDELLEEGSNDADLGPPLLPPPLFCASDDPAIMAEIEATTREVRERAAARERSALLGSPIPPMIAEKTALHRPKTTREDVKRIAGAAIAKENTRREREKKEAEERRESEAKETDRLAEVARAEAAAAATATQAAVEQYQEDFFKEEDHPLPLDKDIALVSTSSTDQKSNGDEEKQPVLSEPWWKEFKMPKINVPRISMPWGGPKAEVTERDEDGYLKSSMVSPAKKKARFAAIVVINVLFLFVSVFWSIFSGDKAENPTTKMPVEIAKVGEQSKEEKQTVTTSDNTTAAAPATSPSAVPSSAPVVETSPASAPSVTAKAPSAPQQPEVPTAKATTPGGKAVERYLAKQDPPPTTQEPSAQPVAKVTPPALTEKSVQVKPAKAPVARAQAPVRQPTVVEKAPPSKTVVQKVPAVAPVPVLVPTAPPTEVCAGAHVHCSEGLAACLERVTLAHDKHVAKGACSWKCGAPCIPPTSVQVSAVPPLVVSPESTPAEPSPSLATSSPPAVPCPEGKELCILKLKLRLGEAAARGACWRCTK